MVTTAAAALVLAVLHLFAGRLRFLDVVPRSRWLSAAGGISVAYVFVHLLPELAAAQEHVAESGALTWLEDHVYLLALLGLCLFYAVERASVRGRGSPEAGRAVTVLSFASYSLYNALIGYLLTERRGLLDLVLFAAALGVHFVVNDYGLRHHHGRAYHRWGRWLCSTAVLGGCALGLLAEIREVHLGLVIAFLAGGVTLNVLKEELPEERQSRLGAFLIGAAAYSALLLVV